jgi:hypothetical protein
MLGGHLYSNLLGDKLKDLLMGAKAKVLKDIKSPRFDTSSLRS